MINRTPWLAGFFLTVASSVCAGDHVLTTAQMLAREKYAGWTYGSSAAKRQVDCVQFVLSVAEACAQERFDPRTRKQILISHLSDSEQQTLAGLIEAENEKVKGVQHALISIGRGTAIRPEDAEPGDLIQYWIKKTNGTWVGHAGVLAEVERTPECCQATILGAHASTNGIAMSDFTLRLSGDDRKVFLVRMNDESVSIGDTCGYSQRVVTHYVCMAATHPETEISVSDPHLLPGAAGANARTRRRSGRDRPAAPGRAGPRVPAQGCTRAACRLPSPPAKSGIGDFTLAPQSWDSSTAAPSSFGFGTDRPLFFGKLARSMPTFSVIVAEIHPIVAFYC